MRPANLLPADARRVTSGVLPPEAFAALGAGFLVATLIGAGYVVEHSKVSQREKELAGVKAQLAAVPAPKPAKETISPTLTAEKDARMTVLDSALSQRVSWDTVLRELSLVLPDDVWLSTMTAKAQTADAAATDPNAAGASTAMTLTGFTYSQEGVARLLTRLALVPHLGNVQLQSSSGSEVGTRRVVAFTIAADVRNTGGPS
jgi:Tfp pilus assembly protein PilN